MRYTIKGYIVGNLGELTLLTKMTPLNNVTFADITKTESVTEHAREREREREIEEEKEVDAAIEEKK